MSEWGLDVKAVSGVEQLHSRQLALSCLVSWSSVWLQDCVLQCFEVQCIFCVDCPE